MPVKGTVKTKLLTRDAGDDLRTDKFIEDDNVSIPYH
jgi:hypothetical protein